MEICSASGVGKSVLCYVRTHNPYRLVEEVYKK